VFNLETLSAINPALGKVQHNDAAELKSCIIGHRMRELEEARLKRSTPKQIVLNLLKTYDAVLFKPRDPETRALFSPLLPHLA